SDTEPVERLGERDTLLRGEPYRGRLQLQLLGVGDRVRTAIPVSGDLSRLRAGEPIDDLYRLALLPEVAFGRREHLRPRIAEPHPELLDSLQSGVDGADIARAARRVDEPLRALDLPVPYDT